MQEGAEPGMRRNPVQQMLDHLGARHLARHQRAAERRHAALSADPLEARNDRDRPRFQRLVERAWHHSPFHRRLYEKAGVTPDKIKTLDDIRRLPFMTREDWMACQAEKPLFGDMITRPESEAIRYHLTSGTSGRQPLRRGSSVDAVNWPQRNNRSNTTSTNSRKPKLKPAD